MSGDELLAEQRRYYVARAPEYDDWWFRRGRYELPPDALAQWELDVAEVEDALDAFAPRGDVLELAAGTGIWTARLARDAATLTAVDASREVLDLNRDRVAREDVVYEVADLFDWTPSRRFDVCFFSFWHSHVPEERFADFWRLVDDALKPGGRFFLVDNAAPSDPTHVTRREREEERRRVADGREFRIVKRYWRPEELAEILGARGWRCEFRRTRHGAFIYGSGAR